MTDHPTTSAATGSAASSEVVAADTTATDAVRVLLVDDDPDYRLLLRLALAPASGFTVVGEAGDGLDAVDAARASDPDLILLDATMPGADAFDALPALRAARPDARIVLIGDHELAELRLAARAAGGLGCLSKATRPSRLPDELTEVAGLVAAVQAVVCRASTRLGRDPRSAGAARRFVTRTLAPGRVGPLLDTVQLLVSELVTNAVVHAGSDVDVAVQLTEQAARIEVTDRDDTIPVPGVAEEGDTSGRGIWMVEMMARDWGVRALLGGGKTVWFELDRDPAAAAQ